jgi:hypothetical protein
MMLRNGIEAPLEVITPFSPGALPGCVPIQELVSTSADGKLLLAQLATIGPHAAALVNARRA